MALVNVAIFLLLTILHNLAYVQKVFVWLSNSRRKQNKNAEGNIAFIFNVISETVNGFV